MAKAINFQKATRKQVLQELEQVFKEVSGCGLPEVSYELYRRATYTGAGEIASPMRINQKQSDGSYRHTMTVAAQWNYCCYADHPIDMEGNPIKPSQIVTMDKWMERRR